MSAVQRKCPACKKLINHEAKFCNFCGQKQIPAKPVSNNLTDKRFFSPAELETLKNNLAEQTLEEVCNFLAHANKYLRQAALEVFWNRSSETEKKQLLKKRLGEMEFAVGLLDLQPDGAELFAELWARASEDPWLVCKYLAWARRREFTLPLEAAKYLESTADDYLRQFAVSLVKK